MKATLMLGLLLTFQAFAQPSGPIVRPLAHNYYLVQCNALQLEADDSVAIFRSGVQVGSGRVMRHDNSLCSILLTGGEARRLDLVVLVHRQNKSGNDRGPDLPSLMAAPSVTPPNKTSSLAVKPPENKNFFNSNGTFGSVYNLNTGQYLTRP